MLYRHEMALCCPVRVTEKPQAALGCKGRDSVGHSEAQFSGPFLHCFQTKGDVLVKRDSEFGCSLYDVFAIHAAGEGFILHFSAHTGYLHVRDGAGGFDQCTCGEEAGEFIAGEE